MLKKDLFGCLRIKEIRDDGNETGLKEGRRKQKISKSTIFYLQKVTSSTTLLTHLASIDSTLQKQWAV